MPAILDALGRLFRAAPVATPSAGSNPSVLKGPYGQVEDTPDDELRAGMCVWARWAIANHGRFTYSEGALRSHMVDSKAGSLPQWADCSAFVTGLAKWAGAPDPSGLGFDPVGYTGTLLQHCTVITAAEARMGDLIVYGPGTGSHAVFIMERLPADDFWCASHGRPGDPSRVKHSLLAAYFDGSVRFLRWLS